MSRMFLAILLASIGFWIVSSESFYVLQAEDVSEVFNDPAREGSFINRAFFECDRHATCNYVYKLKDTKKFGIILRNHELVELTGKAFIWKKIQGKRNYTSKRNTLRIWPCLRKIFIILLKLSHLMQHNDHFDVA